MYDSLIKGKWWHCLPFLLTPVLVANAQVGDVGLGDVGVGSVTGTIVFPVAIDAQKVHLQVVATDLYKGRDLWPGSPYKIPVASTGAMITRKNEEGLPVGNPSLLAWQSHSPSDPPSDLLIDDSTGEVWTGAVSETGTFESGTNGTVSQRVEVTVQWDQSDPKMPQGEYSGWVKLVADIGGASYESSVYVCVNVVPIISISAPPVAVFLDNLQSGQISGQVTFRIDANFQDVQLCVMATDLWKGQPASNPTNPKIALVTSTPVQVMPQNGDEMPSGADNQLEWTADTTGDIEGLPAKRTVASYFESRDAGCFGQQVAVTVVWNQTDSELPPGEYSGFVKLVGSEGWTLSSEAWVRVWVNVVGNQPPVAQAGGDQTVVAGNTVTLDGSASSDPDGGLLAYSWSFISKPEGSEAVIADPTAVQTAFIPDVPGVYVVSLVVSDGTGHSEPATVTVTVNDDSEPPGQPNQPPVAQAGGDQTVEQTSADGAAVQLDGSLSSDPDGDALTYKWTWGGQTASDAGLTVTLPLGLTRITLTVSDGQLTATDTVDVTVQDTTAPVIGSISVNPSVLWPANHKMVKVTVAVAATDNSRQALTCRIADVTSNEPINGPDDGNIDPDWQIADDDPLVVLLRAERSGSGSGRVYTIQVECTDASGNTTTGTVNVTVPHDQGKSRG